MMDIANTLKGLLPKIGFTWDTLLRLFYSPCGWLVIGTLIPVAGASGRTPVGTLRRLLGWFDMPSALTLGMERWCGCCSAAWHRTPTDVDLVSIRALRYMRGALSS